MFPICFIIFNMKKILIPTLLINSIAPIISLVGCGCSGTEVLNMVYDDTIQGLHAYVSSNTIFNSGIYKFCIDLTNAPEIFKNFTRDVKFDFAQDKPEEQYPSYKADFAVIEAKENGRPRKCAEGRWMEDHSYCFSEEPSNTYVAIRFDTKTFMQNVNNFEITIQVNQPTTVPVYGRFYIIPD